MNRISEFRKTANLTQQEFARALNLTQGAVGHYESGIRMPSIGTAKRIVRLLNNRGIACTLSDLFPVET